ncbi:MAG: N-acetylmuramoyl-L-alanine amidase [Eubacteriales bacterium]|nr:N-acetylmuramoyl-L-alanine amidase [Eubacteriales bacterium]
MKKLIIICLTFVLTFVSCFAINVILEKTVSVSDFSKEKRINLVIDAGHGGADAGTIGVDGTKEKGINLSIAQKLYDFAMVSGISSFLVRDGDYLVYGENDDKTRSDLYKRLDYINSINNSLLISIHQNHFEEESEWGMQIWYSPNDSKSPILADKILNITKQNLQPENKRLNKPSDNSYYILYKASVPSVMVECGFMSNTEENLKLQNEKYQKELAYSIMLGLNEYITEEL